MACVHLRRLYQLCQENEVRLSGTDLVRIVCHQCGVQEVCPSVLMESREDDQAGTTEDAPAHSARKTRE